MNTENKPDLIAENIVVTLAYELTVDGKIVDSSEDGEPIVFLQGAGQVIPGLEKALVGMKAGDSKKVIVSASEGYGEKDEDAVVEVPRDEFPKDFPLAVGLEISVETGEEDDDEETDDEDVEEEEFEDDEDDMMEAIIVDFNDETVTLDFNHPLAGKELTFQVTVIELRYATEEEIEHGHVHGDDFDFYFDDEDFEDDDSDDDSPIK